jgi:hypothetical protein
MERFRAAKLRIMGRSGFTERASEFSARLRRGEKILNLSTAKDKMHIKYSYLSFLLKIARCVTFIVFV